MIGALDVAARHPHAVRAECMMYGRSLDDAGTDRFPWNDFVSVIRSTSPGRPIYDAEFPDEAGWTLEAHLLATLADGVHVLAWQGGRRRRADFPRQIPRPGVEQVDTKVYGATPMEFDDGVAFLDRMRAGHPSG